MATPRYATGNQLDRLANALFTDALRSGVFGGSTFCWRCRFGPLTSSEGRFARSRPGLYRGGRLRARAKGDDSPMSSVVYGVLVVCAVSLVALGGLALVQRLVPTEVRQRHNDVAGFIYAVLGVVYAVLLALVVIAVWEEFDAAKDTADQEANALAEIFWLAHQLPELEGRHVQELACSYAEEVVEEEWALMEQGQASPRGWVLIDDIRANLQGYEPHTVADQELYSEGLDQVQRLADARRMRLVAAQE